MYQVVEENILGAKITTVDRKYWSETSGFEYIQQLAFQEDVEAIKVAIGGNFYATCCFAAVSESPIAVPRFLCLFSDTGISLDRLSSTLICVCLLLSLFILSVSSISHPKAQ